LQDTTRKLTNRRQSAHPSMELPIHGNAAALGTRPFNTLVMAEVLLRIEFTEDSEVQFF